MINGKIKLNDVIFSCIFTLNWHLTTFLLLGITLKLIMILPWYFPLKEALIMAQRKQVCHYTTKIRMRRWKTWVTVEILHCRRQRRWSGGVIETVVEQKKRAQAAIRSSESTGVVFVPLLIGISPYHQDLRRFKAVTCPLINTTMCLALLFHSNEIGVTVTLLLWTVAMLLTVCLQQQRQQQCHRDTLFKTVMFKRYFRVYRTLCHR